VEVTLHYFALFQVIIYSLLHIFLKMNHIQYLLIYYTHVAINYIFFIIGFIIHFMYLFFLLKAETTSRILMYAALM